MTRYNNILVIQTAFIGDVVLATALVESIAAAHPAAEIDFLVRKGNEGLLANNPQIREVLIWNKKEQKTRNLLGLLKTIRRKRYDYVINPQRYFSTGLLTAFSGATHRIAHPPSARTAKGLRKIEIKAERQHGVQTVACPARWRVRMPDRCVTVSRLPLLGPDRTGPDCP